MTEACGASDDQTVAALLTLSNLRQTVGRIQNRGNVNMNPKTLAELMFDDKAVTTGRNKKKLLYDSAEHSDESESEKRLVIFGTQENLDVLKECDVIAMDGTFKISPPLI